MMMTCPNFTELRKYLEFCFRKHSARVATESWQGREANGKPDLVTHELLSVTMAVPLNYLRSMHHLIDDIRPHLPWADDHFAERVGGEPLNPGNTWHTWRHAASASSFLEGQKRQFNHTYMERFWPKYAGLTHLGELRENLPIEEAMSGFDAHRGIRCAYGDLGDLVALLVKEPHTRQAYIPLFFPEDTGIADGGRKPCTLGYQFILRDNRLHIYYPMRSCDFANHWADDCYLAVRLVLWVIEQCREQELATPDYAARENCWGDVTPGTFTMHCTSLHLFRNDFLALEKRHGQ